MAEPTKIEIRVNAEAVAQEVTEEIGKIFEEFAMRLRYAADGLDQGKWWEAQEAYVGDRIDKAVKEARRDG